MKLSNATLAELPIPWLSYDRNNVGTGISHFGGDGFHRTFEAVDVDRLLEFGQARDWGICGVVVLPADRRVARSERPVHTLVLGHPDGRRNARVIGSLVDYRYRQTIRARFVACPGGCADVVR